MCRYGRYREHAAPSGKSTTAGQLMNRFVSRHGGRGRRLMTSTRKASDAHENLMSHRERTRRISNEHARAEALVHDSLGTLWQADGDAASATRARPRELRNQVLARGH